MKKLFFAFLSMTFLLASCGKDGKDGAVGPQGATGATGATGNANVSSTTFTVNPTDWVNGGTLWKVSFAVPSITQAAIRATKMHGL